MDFKEERKFTDAINVLDWAKGYIEDLENDKLDLKKEIEELNNKIDQLRKEVEEYKDEVENLKNQ